MLIFIKKAFTIAVVSANTWLDYYTAHKYLLTDCFKRRTLRLVHKQAGWRPACSKKVLDKEKTDLGFLSNTGF